MTSEHISDIRDQFVGVTKLPDDEIDLARVALLVAATQYPQLDIERELDALDALAAAVSDGLGEERDPLYTVNTLSIYLFDKLSFRGNREDYYDPRNSYLNEVLTRRLGIPITLSLVYVEVGMRLNMPLSGVGLPGHFVVRHADVDDLYVDPFHGGILLSEQECVERVRQVTRVDIPWDSRHLDPISKREFIARIIRNLKNSFLRLQDYTRALTMIDLLLELLPHATLERRDRGVVHYHLDNYEEAQDDLRGYLESASQSPDAEAVQRLLGRIQRSLEA